MRDEDLGIEIAIEDEETLSNQERGRRAALRLQAYVDQAIKGKAKVPMRHGRINKTIICNKLKITKSTIGSNKMLGEAFALLETHANTVKPMANPNATYSERYVRELEESLEAAEKRSAIQQATIDSLRRELRQRDAAEQHMIETGRQIRLFKYPSREENQ